MKPGIYKVIEGSFIGAFVKFNFINSSGNADCRFAEDFGVFKKGWTIAINPKYIIWECENEE